MSRFALIEGDPPPRLRKPPRDKRQHPESRADDIKAAVVERAEREVPKGWHWNFGWAIRLYEFPMGMLPPARRNLTEPTYAGAVRTRDQEMRTGKYEKAWIERLNE